MRWVFPFVIGIEVFQKFRSFYFSCFLSSQTGEFFWWSRVCINFLVSNLNFRWAENLGYLPSLRKTIYSAGKGQLLEAKILCLKEQNTRCLSRFRMTTHLRPRRSSLKPAASIPMWMCMEIFAWTFFRYFLFQIFLAGLVQNI